MRASAAAAREPGDHPQRFSVPTGPPGPRARRSAGPRAPPVWAMARQTAAQELSARSPARGPTPAATSRPGPVSPGTTVPDATGSMTSAPQPTVVTAGRYRCRDRTDQPIWSTSMGLQHDYPPPGDHHPAVNPRLRTGPGSPSGVRCRERASDDRSDRPRIRRRSRGPALRTRPLTLIAASREDRNNDRRGPAWHARWSIGRPPRRATPRR